MRCIIFKILTFFMYLFHHWNCNYVLLSTVLHVLSSTASPCIIIKCWLSWCIIQENHQQLQRRPEQLDLERPVWKNIISESLQNNHLQHCLCNDHMYGCIIGKFALWLNILIICEGNEQAGPFVLPRRLAASVQVSPKHFKLYYYRVQAISTF